MFLHLHSCTILTHHGRVITAAIIRVFYLTTSISSSQPLLTGVTPFICLEVEMHYGLMASTFPCLKSFVADFYTAWGTHDPSGTYGYGSLENSRTGQSGTNNSSKLSRSRTAQEEGLQFGDYKNVTQVWSNRNQTSRSERSSNGSQSGIIRQTFTCEVQYEHADQQLEHYGHSSRPGLQGSS